MVTAVVWVAISFVGFVFAGYDVASAYGHYNLVRVGWPEQERLLEFVRIQLYGQLSRAILLLVFLVIGINSLANGPSGVFVYGMFIGNLVVVVMAVRSNLYRREVFRYSYREQGGPPSDDELFSQDNP